MHIFKRIVDQGSRQRSAEWCVACDVNHPLLYVSLA